MKRLFNTLAIAALAIAAIACNKSNADQMTMAENVKVECTPEVLELVAGEIPVTMTVTYPKGYFHPQATMVVTPVLVYEGGQMTGDSYVYQGEDIKDNYKVVSTKGGSVTEKFSFPYVVGCEKSTLELRSVVFYNGTRREVPARKVADGVNTTCKLLDICGANEYKADGYQEVIHQVTEGQIMYDVNSASVKGSQLNSESIRDMKAALTELTDNSRVTVTGTKIVAYASPEGGEKLNTELSDKRASTAKDAWNKITKGMEAENPEVKSIGQDWEGFQEAIAKSNIQDKDLILRVLSMYSDPAVRESEIKNMSQIYTEISDKVFPELRRARFITESDYQNFTDEELEKLAARRLYMMDEPSVLRVAANADDLSRKILLYKLAVSQFNSDVAKFNLAKIYLDQNQASLADSYLDQMSVKDADVMNAKGLVALRSGDLAAAKEAFAKAENDAAQQNLGLIDIIEGKYADAAKKYEGAEGTNAALAQILAGNLDAASKALTGDDAKSEYLRAIIAARKGNTTEARKNLEAASKDADLKARAAKDIEFAALAN